MTEKALLAELERARERIAALERAAAKESGTGRAQSESETLLKHAAALASLGYWVWDRATGRYTHFSEELSGIYGVDDPADLLEMAPTHEASFDLIHSDDRDGYDALVRARREGAILEGNYRIVRPDGEIRHLRDTAAPMPDESGTGFRIFGTIQDVTELKKAERALRDSEERIRLIADNLPVLIVYFDAEERYRFANETWARWYQRPVTEIRGRRLEDVMGAKRYGTFLPAIDAVLSGEPATFDEVVTFPDGVTRETEVIYIPHVAADGGVVGAFVMATDVTDRKRAEEQLRQAMKMEVVGQLTGGIAHDFNNLLAVVLGNADLIKESLRDGDPLNGYIDALTRAATRGADLTSHLLAFSRKQDLRPRSLDADALVDGMMDFLRRTLSETIEIETRHAPGLWAVDADPAQLENVILNLAINARDAMPDGGVLAIESSNVEIGADFAGTDSGPAPGPYMMLAIADIGTGMAADVLDHIFEPFFTTKEVGEGSGLGLSMVYGFAKQSGGHVEIESEIGAGTTVRLYLSAAGAARSDA